MLLPIKVELVPSSPAWPEQAAREMERLMSALGPALCGVHHIGSTAVPGLAAKPILDLMPVTAAPDALASVLETLGYRCWGELGIPGRLYCTMEDRTGRRLVQLHCFPRGSHHITRHLAFRDYLRAHPDCAAAYQSMKQHCADLHSGDSHAYSACKADWIVETEAAALRWYRMPADHGPV
jgi:GrpB-like predicted nucleotidyltransferase (UPF0157 family)